jgi:hypothetical protein
MGVERVPRKRNRAPRIGQTKRGKGPCWRARPFFIFGVYETGLRPRVHRCSALDAGGDRGVVGLPGMYRRVRYGRHRVARYSRQESGDCRVISAGQLPEFWPCSGHCGSAERRENPILWSERRDLNSGPPVPQTGALTGLRYAPNGADYSGWRVTAQPVARPQITNSATDAGGRRHRQEAHRRHQVVAGLVLGPQRITGARVIATTWCSALSSPKTHGALPSGSAARCLPPAIDILDGWPQAIGINRPVVLSMLARLT